MNLGLRVVAGLIDWLMLAAATVPLAVSPLLALAGDDSINASITYSGPRDLKSSLWVTLAAGAVAFMYYSLLEGRWGRSLGKQVCGLEVTARSGEPAGVRRGALRALVFVTPILIVLAPKLGAAASGAVLPTTGWAGNALYWGGDVLLVLIFSSMRRRNGFAGWHDLASGTRVVAVRRRKLRGAIDAPAAAMPPGGDRAAVRRVGPYDVVGIAGLTESGTMLDAFDPALKRNVWIHMLPPGTPAVESARADLGRAGRLRWMNGRRAGDEAWDAYDAPGGAPLMQVCASPQPWRAVPAKALESCCRDWKACLRREARGSRCPRYPFGSGDL